MVVRQMVVVTRRERISHFIVLTGKPQTVQARIMAQTESGTSMSNLQLKRVIVIKA